MLDFFSKLFNIRRKEWPSFLSLYLFTLLLVIAIIWGSIVLYAAFLDQVGAEYLPTFLFVKALIGIPAAALYAGLADRWPHQRLMIGILGLSAAAFTLGLFILQAEYIRTAFFGMYLVMFVPMTSIVAVHWYTYVNGFYDTRAAKRIIPVLITSFGVASIFGGWSIRQLTIPPEQTILAVIGLLLTCCALVWIMPRALVYFNAETVVLEKSSPLKSEPTANKPSYFEEMKEGFVYVRQSDLLRWMSVSALVLILLFTMLEYLVGQTLEQELGTTAQITDFLGTLTTISNIFILFTQLFLLNRIVTRLGLGNANFIFPIGNLIVCLSLVFSPTLIPAALAHATRIDFRNNIGYPIENLLYNAVPLRIKGRARAFIAGLVAPIGASVASILLILIQRWLGESTLILGVRGAIAILAIAYLGIAFIIRREYTDALIELLEQEDFSFLLMQEATDLTVTDPAALRLLEQKLIDSTTPEFTIFMAKLISDIGGAAAIPILQNTAKHPNAHVRATILNILATTDIRTTAVGQIYRDALHDSDHEVRLAAITGLEHLEGQTSRAFLTIAQQHLNDEDINIQAHVIPAILRSRDVSHHDEAKAVLQELLTNDDPQIQARAIQMLGLIGDQNAIQQIIPYLNDDNDNVRLTAVQTIEDLTEQKLPEPINTLIIEKISKLHQDPIERVRQAALVIYGRIGSARSHHSLAFALADPSPKVRATAVEMMVQLGKKIIPIVNEQLDSPHPQQRKAAAVVLSRINPREFGPLVSSHITNNLVSIYRNFGYVQALEKYKAVPSINVLYNNIYEHNQQLTEEILYLLTTFQDPKTIKVITQALGNEDPLTRANAIEALESLTSPQTALLIAPLLAPDIDIKAILDLAEKTWDYTTPNAADLLRYLATKTEDRWAQTIAIFILGKMGGSYTIDDSATNAETSSRRNKQPARRRNRRPVGNLFGSLLDDENTDKPAEEPAPPPPRPTTNNKMPQLLPLDEIGEILAAQAKHDTEEIRQAAHMAQQFILKQKSATIIAKEKIVLSTIEKIIFLKEVPFFQHMTVEQLKIMANVCEEEFFPADTRIYNQNDPGGVLYVVVSGRVAIEREGNRKGSFARIGVIESHSYFGEMNLFDNSHRNASALAVQDTLTLRLRREPLLALARQYPNLSLKLIDVLSQRLRESTDQIAGLTRTKPRELHKLFDQFD
ncbi:MAG TPA: HEAT repeat domain-containing protein [Anaerolineae bacterium]|nr:HEAT repeat domain-containing protein [Anaerolineae bacterium]